jgi:hypothetical protein
MVARSEQQAVDPGLHLLVEEVGTSLRMSASAPVDSPT